jgi:hypothetical protein
MESPLAQSRVDPLGVGGRKPRVGLLSGVGVVAITPSLVAPIDQGLEVQRDVAIVAAQGDGNPSWRARPRRSSRSPVSSSTTGTPPPRRRGRARGPQVGLRAEGAAATGGAVSLIGDLAGRCPVLAAMGRIRAVQETARAIFDAGAWWPCAAEGTSVCGVDGTQARRTVECAIDIKRACSTAGYS